MELDYNKDMEIDPTALDVEWLGQSSLAQKYADHYIKLRKKANKIWEKLKVIKAELIQEANEDPDHCCGKEKPNAADIEAYYRTHRKHIQAKDEWIEATNDADWAKLALENIRDRKKSLEELVQLYIGQWFSGPSIPRNLTKEWETKKRQQRADNKSYSVMKRKKKRRGK